MRIFPISECFLILVPFQIFIKKLFTILFEKPTISISYQTIVKKFFLQEQIKCKRKIDEGKEEWEKRRKEAGSQRKQFRKGSRTKVMVPNN
jgi:hypothetical protein